MVSLNYLQVGCARVGRRCVGFWWREEGNEIVVFCINLAMLELAGPVCISMCVCVQLYVPCMYVCVCVLVRMCVCVVRHCQACERGACAYLYLDDLPCIN